MKNNVGVFLTIVLVNVAGWETNAVSGSAPLAESIARADSAYRSLPVMLAAYNAAVREICEDMPNHWCFSIQIQSQKPGCLV